MGSLFLFFLFFFLVHVLFNYFYIFLVFDFSWRQCTASDVVGIWEGGINANLDISASNASLTPTLNRKHLNSRLSTFDRPSCGASPPHEGPWKPVRPAQPVFVDAFTQTLTILIVPPCRLFYFSSFFPSFSFVSCSCLFFFIFFFCFSYFAKYSSSRSWPKSKLAELDKTNWPKASFFWLNLINCNC